MRTFSTRSRLVVASSLVSALGCAASLGAAIAFAGCSSGDSGELAGEATAAITQVPAQVACIELNVSGARTVDKKFDVTAGQSSVLAMAQLPTGNVTFTGFAYPTACAQVTAGMTATWISDPTPATLVAGTPTNVTVVLKKNGSASVGVDFQDDDAGASTGPATIAVSPPSLDFGAVNCGQGAASKVLTVTNTGTVATTINAALLTPFNGYALSGAGATVPPGGTLNLTVTPGLVSPGAPIPSTIATTVNVTTPGGASVNVPVTETAQGAQFVFNPPSISTGTFGGSQTVTLANTGNAPAVVNLTSSNSAISVNPPSVSLAPGSQGTFTVSGIGSSQISITTNTAVCGTRQVLQVN
jgi:hypothetical protein